MSAEEPKKSQGQAGEELMPLVAINGAATNVEVIDLEPVTAAPKEMPFGRVLTYQDADDEQRARMDAVIAKLDILKEDTILNAGSKSLIKIRDLSREIATSIIMDEQAGLWGTTVQKMSTALESCAPDKLAEVPTGLLGYVTATFRTAKDKIARRNPVEAASRRALDKLRENLGDAEETIGGMIQVLENQVISIDKNHKRIVQMRNLMGTSAEDLEITAAAVGEYKRRVEKDTLPAAREKFEETGLSQDQQKLETIVMNAELLTTHHADLVGSCGNAIMLEQVLNRARMANRRSLQQTKGHLTNSVVVWAQELAAFGILNKELVHRGIITQANQMTDEAVKTSARVFGNLITETAKTSKRGTFDLNVVMKANADVLSALKEAARLEIESGRELEHAVKAAQKTTVVFSETAQKMEIARLTGDGKALEKAEEGYEFIKGSVEPAFPEIPGPKTADNPVKMPASNLVLKK